MTDPISGEEISAELLAKRQHNEELTQRPDWATIYTIVQRMGYVEVYSYRIRVIEEKLNNAEDETEEMEAKLRLLGSSDKDAVCLLRRLRSNKRKREAVRKELHDLWADIHAHPDAVVGQPLGPEYYHLLWDIEKEIFRAKYDIEWYTPDELNPEQQIAQAEHE